MGEALAEAEAALRVSETPVGCVFVHPSRGILGRGHNRTVASRNATRHAELEAIDRILAANSVDDLAACTLFVTVEPCIMCASALRQIGLRKVVFGAANDKFGGCGSVLSIHDDQPVPGGGGLGDAGGGGGGGGGGGTAGLQPLPAHGGVRESEAVALLRLFYATTNQGAPVPQKRTRRQQELAETAAAFLREGSSLDASAAQERIHAHHAPQPPS